MPDQKPRVDGQGPLETVEVVTRARPVERHPRPERLERHPFDHGEHTDEVVPGVRHQGGQGEATVPSHHRRHPVQRRRCQRGIPERLGVEVSVDVAESGGHHEAVGIERPPGGADDTDRDDPAVEDADVRPAPGRSGPVDHVSAANRQIEHWRCLSSVPTRGDDPLHGGVITESPAKEATRLGRPLLAARLPRDPADILRRVATPLSSRRTPPTEPVK